MRYGYLMMSMLRAVVDVLVLVGVIVLFGVDVLADVDVLAFDVHSDVLDDVDVDVQALLQRSASVLVPIVGQGFYR